MTQKASIILTGAGGQVGTELTHRLRAQYGPEAVLATDVRPLGGALAEEGPTEVLDVMDHHAFRALIEHHRPDQVYHLAALLSATAEEKPQLGWKLNMESLLTVLELARAGYIGRVFWPSSIGAFGPNTPKDETPQYTIMDPTTVYGITKLAGERWCQWYHRQFNVDVRSLRYPGLISYNTQPGGGTTDYAVHIFIEALHRAHYESFLSAETRLPMMYMDDAIRATLELMHAPGEGLRIRDSYNLAGLSFTPSELAEAIRSHISSFDISYAPDRRQQIADSWPRSIDDHIAREDWGWQPEYDLERLVATMLEGCQTIKL